MDLSKVPAWLTIPVNYYKTTGKNFRLELFKQVTGDKLDEKSINLVTIILNLFQLSIIMLDDIFDVTNSRRGQKTMHLEYGTTLVSAWAIGLSHYIYQVSSEYFDEDVSEKFNKLYNEVGIRTLRGQCYELTIKDYRQIVKYKTTYYTVSFPAAIYVLLKTKNLKTAMEFMEDEHLQEIGYLFQAENDFLGNFEEDNTDIEMKSWTILIDMLSKKVKNFTYPETKKDAQALFIKYNIYGEFVENREAGLAALREKLVQMQNSKEVEADSVAVAKRDAIKFCLAFFETYKYAGPFEAPSTPAEVAKTAKPAEDRTVQFIRETLAGAVLKNPAVQK